jgi:hypothetical protein
VTWHRFVPSPAVEDYLRLGWLPHPGTLLGTNHGEYGRLHMEWRCACAMPDPLAHQ